MTYIPARNKLEVVARISSLTNSGPETLGPGSKERKSVVVNLANGLGVSFNSSETKQEIAQKTAIFLGRQWSGDCESVGQTLTLKGLNLLLEGATQFLKNVERVTPRSFSDEIAKISDVVVSNTPQQMDGKTCIVEMRDAEYSKWRQTEWQGFYFEFKVCPALINSLGGGPKKVLNTTFDYALTNPWDLKVHSLKNSKSKPNPSSQLNDKEAIREAIGDGGIGFIILSGIPTYDPEFTMWHKKFRGNISIEFGRTLKKSFQSERIDFFYIKNRIVLDSVIKKGIISDFNQGKQSTGEARKPKFMLNIEKSLESDIHVHSHLFS
jgi:hypothetical protein